ncbi:MAG: 4Fe-4S binding protein [Alphaproteobacteria bacterium]|uniref:4Fe-4S binding protein n=1 Tax=Candidatus Nitrobium versatile TaxID=2884831 RepID=A0A953M2S0_9BACT|nr:4Fe-4S binding protein [Candidatus Nitrobium versatile]
MNTGNDRQGPENAGRQAERFGLLPGAEGVEDASQASAPPSPFFLPLSKLRRFFLLGVLALFFLQFARVESMVGSLSGSSACQYLRLIDVFAFLESLAASRDFTVYALTAVLPVAGLYLVFGRAFCGWLCPMDFLYEIVEALKVRRNMPPISIVSAKTHARISSLFPKIGCGVAGVFLLASFLAHIPLFSNYFSHLTHFFRFLTGAVFFVFALPVEGTVLLFSAGGIAALLLLECVCPRLWCRALCPVGRTYGLFNKISLLRLSFTEEGECGECNLCDQKCYMQVKIARHIDQPGIRDMNCIYCGRCMDACATKGRLIKMKFGRKR